MNTQQLTYLSLIALATTQSIAAERDVQFVNILPDVQVLMLGNLGEEAVSLDGWRFCTQNSSQVRVYTTSSGLNGITIEPNTSITIHLNNDASTKVPNQYNASDIGAFAGFELGAYALAIYFPNEQGNVPFSDGNFMADYLQWSLGGVDNDTADERADEAQDGGLWVDQSQWISVRNDTLYIALTDPTGAQLHSPANYDIIINCPADITDDGLLNFFDISAFLTAFAAMDPAADFNNNELFNFFDISLFLTAFSNGCP